MTTSISDCDWPDYIVADYNFADFPAGSRILDVGFGSGAQMRKLRAAGCRPLGVEYDHNLAVRGAARGLAVCRAQAEHLPLATASVDGLLCKVVIPYTDEARAIAEIGRVLRPKAAARVSYHGLGFSLRYLFTARNWKRRIYAARVVVNTFIYRTIARRLPGFWGDTIYQSTSRLRRYYERAGLELVDERPPARFAGAPVFLYHTLRKKANAGSA